MIEFKTIKYKHIQDARALQKRLNATDEPSEADQTAMDNYVFSLVKAWDFVDAETGQIVPVEQPGELTIPQYNELYEAFNAQMAGDAEVKKTNAAPSPSGSTPSKGARKRPPKGRNG